MSNCEFSACGGGWCCGNCGRVVRLASEKPPLATCRRGLGDMVAGWLASVGITKERAQAVASVAGIDDCGCTERQAFLTRLGKAVGFPPGRDETNPPGTAG